MPAPTPPSGDGDGQAHGQHRPERDDQHQHGEGQPDQLGLRRRRPPARYWPPGKHLEALDGGGVVADRLPEETRFGVVDVGGQVHLGVGDRAGERPGRAIWPARARSTARRRCRPGAAARRRRRGTRRRRASNSSSMAARTSGSSTPWSALNTIVPDWPPVPSSGKCSSSTAKPAALPEPGTSDVALKCEPDGAGRREDRDERDQPEADRLGPVVEAPAADRPRTADASRC